MDAPIIFVAQYLYLTIVVGALWYVFHQPRELRLSIIVCALIALSSTYVVAKIMGMFYYDARPFVVSHFVPLIPHAPDNGFPSDHTLLSAAIAAAIFSFERKLGVFLFMVALLVGLARVAAGIHHMTDIIGSMVIATLVTYGVSRFFLPRIEKHMPMSLRKFFLQ